MVTLLLDSGANINCGTRVSALKIALGAPLSNIEHCLSKNCLLLFFICISYILIKNRCVFKEYSGTG